MHDDGHQDSKSYCQNKAYADHKKTPKSLWIIRFITEQCCLKLYTSGDILTNLDPISYKKSRYVALEPISLNYSL
jgi:hypothetical protein